MKDNAEFMKLLSKVEDFLKAKYDISAIGPGHRLAYAILAARQKALVENGRFATIKDFIEACVKLSIECGLYVNYDAMARSLYRAIKRINGEDEHDLWAVSLRLARECEGQK